MVVFQESALMPWLTTYQNVAFGPKLRGDLRGRELDREIGRLIDKVGLADFKDKYPLQLSGGMQRRAELARAMINSPSIMIMDEPFRGLDAMTRELMQEFLLRLFEETGRTHFFVTSEIEEAIFLADQLVVLSNRPVTVREVIDIALPRPREFHMLSTPEAYEYKREALEILHEEAMKSFGGRRRGTERIGRGDRPPRLSRRPLAVSPAREAGPSGRPFPPIGRPVSPVRTAQTGRFRQRGSCVILEWLGQITQRPVIITLAVIGAVLATLGADAVARRLRIRTARYAMAAPMRIRRDVGERRTVHRRRIPSPRPRVGRTARKTTSGMCVHRRSTRQPDSHRADGDGGPDRAPASRPHRPALPQVVRYSFGGASAGSSRLPNVRSRCVRIACFMLSMNSSGGSSRSQSIASAT